MTANESKYLGLGDDWLQNMELARDEECNPDCTKTYTNLCYAECEGINGCDFFDGTSMALCNQKAKYVIMGYDEDNIVECCEGIPKSNIPSAEPQVEFDDADLVVRITKPVLYRGKLVQMVITVGN